MGKRWAKMTTQISETQVRRTVEAFYEALNAGTFDRAAEFTTENWTHIKPEGGALRGRDNVAKELNGILATFLKGVTDTIDEMSVEFATDDVAIAVVTSHMSPFVIPGGITLAHEHCCRSFVVVKQNDRWRIMHDQNTISHG
jgi:uncharacterized protein (TIGR02246 family)